MDGQWNGRAGNGGPLVLTRSEHSVSRRHIDPDALKILFRLQRLGFTAYLTGGAVRDMLLGKTPKDFDIATDARPNQIRKYFANAFIIGRRFRLAHIHFRGGKVIEVATFRKDPGPAAGSAVPSSGTAFAAGQIPAAQKPPEEGGAVMAAGERAPLYAFGTPAEDAWRRDITVNALFYDPATATVIDHVGGVADLRQGRIRVIGNACERFREDPVRIWRVIRYAARLGFAIDAEIADAIGEQRGLLRGCSDARLYEEFSKDLLGPCAREVFVLHSRYGTLPLLLGRIGEAYQSDPALSEELSVLLEIADREKARGRNVSLEEAACLLFWPWAAPQFGMGVPDPMPVLKKAFLSAGMAVALPKGMRAQIIDIMALAARMSRALSVGAMRWSARQRPQYELASRLCFIANQRREPLEGESFETLYQQAFPGKPTVERAGRSGRRRRRRRQSPAAQ